MGEEGTMESKSAAPEVLAKSSARVSELLQQYGCGPIPFVGTENAFYERPLVFDRVIDPKVATARERFEAFSRSVRDILAQRWVLTKATYEKKNAKRIYYLSLEFLIGRSLANNVSNLLLDPVVQHAAETKRIDWFSSDRTIAEYASDIWKVEPCPVR
jgi:starch phosphorylase